MLDLNEVIAAADDVWANQYHTIGYAALQIYVWMISVIAFTLSVLTLNALTAADSVIIPIQCEYYALEGLNQVLKTIYLVKRKLNPELRVEGVLFTMYDQRTNLSEQVVATVRENLNEPIYDTIIPRNVKLAEAPSHGEPITIYDTGSRGAESYRLLAAEIMSKEGEL